jgi:hypothetical protein
MKEGRRKIWKTQREGVSCLLEVRRTDRQTDRSTACDGSKDILKYSCRKGTSLSFCCINFWQCQFSGFVSRIFTFFVKDCHVLCHGLSYIASRNVMSCVTDCRALCHGLSCFVMDCHVFVTNCHVFVMDCHVLCHRLSCFVSRVVMICVTDCRVLHHCWSCLVSRIVMFCVTNCHFCVTNCHVCVTDCHILCHCLVLCEELSCVFHGLSSFVSRIVTFCVTDYLLGFDLCSVALYINASAEHISSMFMVKYAPL